MNGFDGLLLLFSQIDGLVRFDLGIIDDARYVISGAGFTSARAVSNERFSVVVGAVLQTNPARSANQVRRHRSSGSASVCATTITTYARVAAAVVVAVVVAAVVSSGGP